MSQADDMKVWRDIRYRQAWSQALGALILTLAADEVDVDRARAEAEELKYVLNEAAGLPVPDRRR